MLDKTTVAAFAIGTFTGTAATYLLVVDPLRRTRKLLRRRIIQEQMRTFQAQARLAVVASRRGDNADTLRVVK